MQYGIYVGLSGAVLTDHNVDMISHNLANVSTPGYKREEIAFRSYLMDEDRGPGGITKAIYPDSERLVTVGGRITDLSPGEITHTGNPLDVAIEGKGFIAVETPAGERYTRSGNLKLDGEGLLQTAEGFPVLSGQGPINLPKGRSIVISQDGGIDVDNARVSSIRMVGLDSPVKIGQGFYSGQVVPTDARILQGSVEGSNVEVFREMVGLIEAVRAYETNQKVIQSFDNIYGRAANDLGRI